MSNETKVAKVELRLDDYVSQNMGKVKGEFKELDASINTHKSSMDSLTGVVKGTVAAYLTFEGAKKGLEFIIRSAEESNEATKIQAKLRAALGYTSQALNEQAETLKKKTDYDDDDIKKGESLLALYVKNADAIQKLTPAIVDLAAGTGQDLNTAFQQVTRSIADDSGELGRYKIQVEGAAGSAQRIDSVIKGLSDKFGGQAEAIHKADNGLNDLGKSYEDFIKGIGYQFTPAVSAAAKVLTSFFDSASKFLNNGMIDTAAIIDQAKIDRLKQVGDELKRIDEARKSPHAGFTLLGAMTPENIANYNKLLEEQKTLMHELGKDNQQEFKAPKEQKFDPSGLPSQMNIEYALQEAEAINKIQGENSQKADELAKQRRQQDLDDTNNFIKMKIFAERTLATSELDLQIQNATSWEERQKLMRQKEVDELRNQQQQELDSVQGSETAITAIKEAHTNQRILFAQKQAEIEKQNIVAGTRNFLGYIESMTQGHNKYKAIYKAAAASQALMDTKSAAISAYKAMAGIPYVGPILGAAAAGTVTAFGLMNMKEILSAATGADFITNGPQLMLVGDNSTRREHVQVTPQGTPNINGPQGGTPIHLHFYDRSGTLTDELTAELRDGTGQRLIDEVTRRMQ